MNNFSEILNSITPVQYVSGEFLTQLLRYFGLAGATFAVVWKWPRFRNRKLDPLPIWRGQITFEISHALMTIAIFTLVGGSVFYLHTRFGIFRFYEDPLRYGALYLALSPILLVVLHDTYFYWTHRLMHHRHVFRTVHRAHHRSVSPTPFTIYSFHPIEAFVEGLFIPLISLALPLHGIAVILLLVAAVTMNLVGHLGFELFGRKFWRSIWSEFLTTTTYHQEHHQGGPNSNFGFYFRFWDRLCGTEDRRYAKELSKRREVAPSHEPGAFPVRPSGHDRPLRSS